MKKLLSLLLALSLVFLCGCTSDLPLESIETIPSESTDDSVSTSVPSVPEESGTVDAPSTDATEESSAQTEPLTYRNPLNGEILDAPYTGRVFAYSISNTSDALPHVGAIYADVIMEMFVNNSVVRCLGLFSDISDIDAIGSTRSTRLMFNDIAQHYDAILCHAGGSDTVLNDLKTRGIDHFNVEYSDAINAGASYRDKTYGRGQVHSLFGVGSGLLAYSELRGFSLTRPEDKSYGFQFTEDGTPDGGETAEQITVSITYSDMHKKTTMSYDADLGQYVYYQYGKKMTDQITGETEAFENVVVMFTDLHMNGNYQYTEFKNGGSGYYACGGKIIPIRWSCAGDDQPFEFFTEDGNPVSFGVGRTYIAITANGSSVTW